MNSFSAIRASFYCFAGLFGLIFGLVLGGVGGDSIPAWTQAIGSIVGIAVAIAVPAWMKVREDQEKKSDKSLRAMSLAVTILPAVDVWASRLHDLQAKCASVRAGTANYSEFSEKVRAIVDIPKPLHSRLCELHVLGDLAMSLQQAVLKQRWLFDNATDFDFCARLLVPTRERASVGRVPSSRDEMFLNAWADAAGGLSESVTAAQQTLRRWLEPQVGFKIPILGPSKKGDVAN